MTLIVATIPAVLALLIFLDAPRVRPNRTLSRPLGDATAQRARLRLVMGGGGR